MPAGQSDDMWIGAKHDPALLISPDPHNEEHRRTSITELPYVLDGKATLTADLIGEDYPTEEELRTLPRIADAIPWRVYTVAFVELCERFSYYGTQILFQNFVQRPLLTNTGSAPNPSGDTNNNPGALGQGQRTATGLSTFFSFWCYCTPLLGAWIADTYLGRYNTIMVSIAMAVVGHVILIVSAVPSVLHNPNGALGAYVVALIIFGLGTGGFKPNISPLIAEQVAGTKLRVIERNGKKLIVDPAQTSARIYNWFYLFINIGALIGQLTMSYTALYEGYWLAYLLPTILFLCCPLVLVLCKKNYKLSPPSGSVLGPAMRLLAYATKGRWSLNPIRTVKNMRDMSFWENVKPSKIPIDQRPKWMTFDDQWVDEVRRGFKACTVFLWYPLYWVTYNQLNNNFTSQADTMRHAGVPPEIVAQLDPLALIIFIPIADLVVYPGLRKMGIKFTPIKKISLGFIFGALAMVWAAVVQSYIYKHNDCGYYPSETLANGDACPPATISIWVQSGSYVLLAFSEILASITSLEYAFTKAPKNMRSMVQAVALFMTAFASAIGEALIDLSADPLLVWNYGVMGCLAFAGGCLFWLTHRKLDSTEDELNMLPSGHVGTGAQGEAARRRSSIAEIAMANATVELAKEK